MLCGKFTRRWCMAACVALGVVLIGQPATAVAVDDDPPLIPKVVPWVEIPPEDPNAVAMGVAGLAYWRTVTDTAIVKCCTSRDMLMGQWTDPNDPNNFYAGLRRGLADANVAAMRIIPAFAVISVVDPNTCVWAAPGDPNAWTAIAAHAKRVLACAEDPNAPYDPNDPNAIARIVIDGESTLWRYSWSVVDGNWVAPLCAFDPNAHREGLDALLEVGAGEIWWYPAVVSGYPNADPNDPMEKNHRMSIDVCENVYDALGSSCRFMDHSYGFRTTWNDNVHAHTREHLVEIGGTTGRLLYFRAGSRDPNSPLYEPNAPPDDSYYNDTMWNYYDGRHVLDILNAQDYAVFYPGGRHWVTGGSVLAAAVQQVRGDMNCDGVVNEDDADGFDDALGCTYQTEEPAEVHWLRLHPECPYFWNADSDCSGDITEDDRKYLE